MKKFLLFLATAAMLFSASCSKSDDFDSEPEMPQTENEIWYTSKDSSVVTPYKTDVFGANIISNTYKNGKGVIKFDGNVTSIGTSAFERCSSLTSITIPNGVTTIGESAFYGCSSLENFYGKYASEDNKCLIVDGVLNSYAIASDLKTYTIPDSVTSIGDMAFSNCESLTNIELPGSVTSIGDYAFACTSLESIYCKAKTAPKLGEKVFEGISPTAKIYVPMESVEAYKKADGWKTYANIIEGYNF